jgi:serine/threonine-protein kinase
MAEAHIALARVLQHGDWDWAGAERELKRAIELNPRSAEAHHMYSHYLMPLGRAKEAVDEAERAVEVDGSDVLINVHLGWAYLFARRYGEAVLQLQKAVAMDPDLATTRELLGRALVQTQMHEEAITEFKTAMTLSGATGENPAAGLGRAYAVAGRTDEALKTLATLRTLHEQRQVSSYALAVVYAAVGEQSEALTLLERAYEERAGGLLLVNVDPAFDSIRGERRFASLVQRIGLTP